MAAPSPAALSCIQDGDASAPHPPILRADSGSGGSISQQGHAERTGVTMADGPVAEVLLRRLEAADGGLDSAELATELGVEHQSVVGAVKSLQALGQVSRASDTGLPRFCICNSFARRALPPRQILSVLVRGDCIRVQSECAGGESGKE